MRLPRRAASSVLRAARLFRWFLDTDVVEPAPPVAPACPWTLRRPVDAGETRSRATISRVSRIRHMARTWLDGPGEVSMRHVSLRPLVPFGVLFLAAGCGGCSSSEAAADAGQDVSASGDALPSTDTGAPPDSGSPAPDASVAAAAIKHVVMIMQENRSFDHYFGMFPGANGYTLDANGNPTNCNPDPHLDGGCVPVYHDPSDVNAGGRHSAPNFVTCYDNGAMDGFIKNAETSKTACADPQDPSCANGTMVDVMGYKLEADIPNYWAYAKQFVLQDHLYETDASWSWPMHQYMVSEWAALCTSADPMSCTSNIGGSEPDSKAFYSWTPLTYLL